MSNNIEYVTIKIPKDLIESIEDYIKNTKLGYRNRTELIIEAVRTKISKSISSGE
ncbi:MAG: ribbon-helix-helix domain-containing protein [Candidatus Helarchaeota archaeon]